MKTKYITIAIVVITAFSLGAFSWQDVNSEENRDQVNLMPHTDREGKEHEINDHDEQGTTKSTSPDEHVEQDKHADGNGEEAHLDVVRLSDAELREFGIRLETAQGGALDTYIELPGEIVLNADRIAHVVPRVAGIVREVQATVGDQVKKGQLLAVLESRELADAKASYLAAVEKETSNSIRKPCRACG